MRHIKKEIIQWLHAQHIKHYKLRAHDTLGFVVDVEDDVDLNARQLESIDVNFGVVHGDFDCSDNLLTSLEGSPQEVKNNFYCINNRLKNLVGAPECVGSEVWLQNNQLTSIEHLPKTNSTILLRGNVAVHKYADMTQYSDIMTLWRAAQEQLSLRQSIESQTAARIYKL